MKEINDVKNTLKERRVELGYTMKELANLVGVSEATVSRWESGDIANMRRDRIAKLAQALKISPAVIMGWEDSSSSGSDQADTLFIEKYGQPVYDAAMTFAALDEVDQGRITERMGMLLEDDKYKRDSEPGEKAI